MTPATPRIGEILGHYRLEEKIGAGGMGVVYRAHDERLDRDVALKVLPPDVFIDENARTMFHREAHILSRLTHNNIATVFDFDTKDNLDFLVMEYVHGDTLAEKLTNGALPEKEALVFSLQIVQALEEAHAHSVVHCDLKPGNIMVTTSQQIKLLDFGLAKRLKISETSTTQTQNQLTAFGGTLPYMSPEQLRGKAPDFRSDVYSFGAVLYEMATGRRPFDDKVSPVLTDRILHEFPKPPSLVNPSISSRFQDLILKCLEKDAADRYQSVKEIAVDLRHLVKPTTAPADDESVVHEEDQKKRRSRLLLRAGAAIALVFIGLAYWYWKDGPRKPQVVLIGDFSNRTDERVFDDVIPELLTIDIEQSGYISVFPSSRKSQTLRLMKLTPNASIDEQVGREICEREALDGVILGSITKLGSRYVLTVRVISSGGDSLASTEDVMPSAGDLPSSLDRISKYLRKALGEPKHEIQGSSVPVADITSSSLPAIRSFLEGKKLLYQGLPQEAKASFERALELDGSFAMAREYLGIAYIHQGNPVLAAQELEKTLPLLDHVTEQERRKILGDYNLIWHDFDQAIVHFRILKDLRPKDPAPSLNLAQCYAAKLDFDSALQETKAAIAIESGAGPQNNLAEIYLLKGDIPNALGTVAEVLKKDPESVRGMETLGWALLLKGQRTETRDTFERMIRFGGDAESRGRSALADVAISSGSYRDATQQLEAGMTVDRGLGNLFAAQKKQITLLSISLEQARTPSSLGQELLQ